MRYEIFLGLIIAGLVSQRPADCYAHAAAPQCPELDPCNIDFNALCTATTLRALTGVRNGNQAAVLVSRMVNEEHADNILYWANAMRKLAGPLGRVYSAISDPPNIRNNLPNLPKLDIVWADGLPDKRSSRAAVFASISVALKPGGRFIVLARESQKICGSVRSMCSGPQPIMVEDRPRDAILTEVRQAGLAFDFEKRRIFDPAIPPASEFVCIGSSFKDGTHWHSSPLLWQFHKPSS